ncbi:hypothetical protein [Hominifimenecus sp. rT4P-3]|uniref:hypothetical protein n=1 Tax=Hominifimenecus sp. rT4P-3 TaxID=3242979 RepID=UPI003DA5E518
MKEEIAKVRRTKQSAFIVRKRSARDAHERERKMPPMVATLGARISQSEILF